MAVVLARSALLQQEGLLSVLKIQLLTSLERIDITLMSVR